MQPDNDSISKLQEEILTWYAQHQRDLPWRETRNPYNILISEIMSQQTQIGRVVPKYKTWMERFPTIQSLASAPTGDVLNYWSGLGYNRRAINLQRAAKVIVEEYEGIFPKSVDALKKLPGIGEYTASAIACFAFDQQIAVIDTNVRKVILKKVLKEEEGRHDSASMKEIRNIAEQLLPKGRAYEWNQALMDYVAANLKKEKIPIPKQSTFKGSNRYYRGQAVKLLIEYKGVSIKELGKRLVKDEQFINNIVDGLVKDGIAKREKDHVSLP